MIVAHAYWIWELSAWLNTPLSYVEKLWIGMQFILFLLMIMACCGALWCIGEAWTHMRDMYWARRQIRRKRRQAAKVEEATNRQGYPKVSICVGCNGKRWVQRGNYLVECKACGGMGQVTR